MFNFTVWLHSGGVTPFPYVEKPKAGEYNSLCWGFGRWRLASRWLWMVQVLQVIELQAALLCSKQHSVEEKLPKPTHVDASPLKTFLSKLHKGWVALCFTSCCTPVSWALVPWMLQWRDGSSWKKLEGDQTTKLSESDLLTSPIMDTTHKTLSCRLLSKTWRFPPKCALRSASTLVLK